MRFFKYVTILTILVVHTLAVKAKIHEHPSYLLGLNQVKLYHDSLMPQDDSPSKFFFNVRQNFAHNSLAMMAYLNSKAYKQYCLQIIARDLVLQKEHLEKFGVSLDACKNLYKGRSKIVVDKILALDSLQQEQALRLWNKYCLTRYMRKCNKEAGFIKIVKAFEDRDRNEQERLAQEETQKHAQKQAQESEPAHTTLPRSLESLHEQYQLPPQYFCNNIDSPVFEEREQALQKTIDQDYVQYKKEYHFDPQVAGFLRAYGLQAIDYQQFFGTTLQHQLHGETKQLFHQMAQQKNIGFFVADVINFADAAHEQNVREQISAAAVLLDTAWTLAGIPIGLAQGAVDLAILPFQFTWGVAKTLWFATKTAAVNSEEFLSCGPEAEKLRDQHNQLILDKANQLIEITKVVAKALYFAAETIALNDPDVLLYGGPATHQKLYERNELIKKTALESLKDKTPHDVTKEATRFIATFVYPGKMLHAFGHLYAGIACGAKGLRTAQGAATLLGEELSIESIFAEIAEATSALEPATTEGINAQKLVECMQAESAIAQATHMATKPLHLLIDEIRAREGAIPLCEVDLFNEFKTASQNVIEQINTPISEIFRKKYEKIKIDKVNVSLNLKHIAQNSIKFEKKKGVYEIMIELSHQPGTCRAFEQTGLIKIIDVKKLPNGCHEYSLQNVLNGKFFTKTEFPNHWTVEKITQRAWDAYKYGTRNATKEGKITKQYHIDNIDISIILKETLSDVTGKVESANIITILPY